MDVIVKCVPSAFKHGVTETNIRHAVLNWRYDDVFEDDPDKHLLIGFDSNANLLEIMDNVIDEQNLKAQGPRRVVRHLQAARNPDKHLLIGTVRIQRIHRQSAGI